VCDLIVDGCVHLQIAIDVLKGFLNYESSALAECGIDSAIASVLIVPQSLLGGWLESNETAFSSKDAAGRRIQCTLDNPATNVLIAK
jgi:hypothetical protein